MKLILIRFDRKANRKFEIPIEMFTYMRKEELVLLLKEYVRGNTVCVRFLFRELW